MLEGTVKVNNDLGLHARAAAQLVRLAGRFSSKIFLNRIERHVLANSKSILSVLTLAAAKGTELRLVVEGIDEAEAYEQISELFRNGFGEL